MAQSSSEEFQVQHSRRDPGETSRRLSRWLGEVSSGAPPEVTLNGDLAANGVSSETIPVRVRWPAPGEPADGADYMVRVAPSPADVPVFRGYRLDHQFEVIRLVGELTDVPVPTVRWLDKTGDVLGQPCFVMDAISGRVPPDVLPYNFGDSWLFRAGERDQRRLQDASVSVLARVHAIPDPAVTFAFLTPDAPGTPGAREGTTPLRRHLAWTRDWYEFAAEGLARSPLLDSVLAWLEHNRPSETEDPVLCWGDARIGNILYRDDFTPAGVLDWEMAALGPRQLDLAWMIFAHRVFEHLATAFGFPGMPGFLREEDVVATYERLTGRRVGDLTWYYLYAAVQWALIFMRTGTAQVHFGEMDMPDDVEGLFRHRDLLEQMARAAGALA